LINEIRFELRDYLKELDSEPGRLNELEERLSALRVLQKKYGATANEILHSLATIEAEIGDLENSDENLVRLEAELDALERDLLVRAQAIHKMRNDAATAMADAVNTELKDLNMKGVHFRVEVREQNELSSTGLDVVEFMTQSASTEPARPLAKVASGGELSRILLAVKQVVGAGQFPRTYLFDEVDAGVSGPTAEKVGRKLKRIAEGQQVICVTHLPQVASFGDAHFLIHKKAGKKNQPPETAVSELANQDRVQEIARLISGEKITSTSLAHAAQLLTESARPRSESAQRRNAESTAH
jgi:DNA repair protein RecN (Recombination protein N)